MSSNVDIAAPGIGLPEGDEGEEQAGLWRRAYDNLRTGNLGIVPIVIGLAFIVVFFSFKATNFFTADNFNNIIVQMAGLTMLAFGVVFVLLLGEIDLSIGYLSGIAALAVAEFQLPGSGHAYPGIVAIAIAVGLCALHRRRPGLGRGQSRRTVVRRHARGPLDLAGSDPAGARDQRDDRDPGLV